MNCTGSIPGDHVPQLGNCIHAKGGDAFIIEPRHRITDLQGGLFIHVQNDVAFCDTAYLDKYTYRAMDLLLIDQLDPPLAEPPGRASRSVRRQRPRWNAPLHMGADATPKGPLAP